MAKWLTKHKSAITLPLLAVMLVLIPMFTMGLVWVRDVGLLSADAVVFASNAPAMDRLMATAMKGVYGSRVQVCDGTADQVEIQAAVDAGHLTQLSSGTFTDNAPIMLDTYDTLQGAGRKATHITLAASADCNIIQTAADNVHRYDIVVEGLSLDGNKANTAAGNGIAIYSTWYSALRDLDIRNMSGAGIYYGDPGDGGQNPHIENVEICLCEGTGIDIAYGSCTDGSIWNARCYSNGMVTGYNVQIACSNWQVYSLNASVTPASKYNVRVDGSEFGVSFYGLTITDTEADGNGLVVYAANAWNYGTRVIGGYIENEAVAPCTGYGIYLRQGGSKQVQDFLCQGARIDGYGYAVRVASTYVKRAQFVNNVFQAQDVGILSDAGEGTQLRGNTGYIAKGEKRSAAGSLTAGAANAYAFAWRNPEAQDVLIQKVVIRETTAGGAAGSVMDVGITDNATSTAATLLENIDLNYVNTFDSWVATDNGTQVDWMLLQDSASATGGWITGQIQSANATNLVGGWYVEYIGA